MIMPDWGMYGRARQFTGLRNLVPNSLTIGQDKVVSSEGGKGSGRREKDRSKKFLGPSFFQRPTRGADQI